jgi:hypothetical protein
MATHMVSSIYFFTRTIYYKCKKRKQYKTIHPNANSDSNLEENIERVNRRPKFNTPAFEYIFNEGINNKKEQEPSDADRGIYNSVESIEDKPSVGTPTEKIMISSEWSKIVKSQ